MLIYKNMVRSCVFYFFFFCSLLASSPSTKGSAAKCGSSTYSDGKITYGELDFSSEDVEAKNWFFSQSKNNPISVKKGSGLATVDLSKSGYLQTDMFGKFPYDDYIAVSVSVNFKRMKLPVVETGAEPRGVEFFEILYVGNDEGSRLASLMIYADTQDVRAMVFVYDADDEIVQNLKPGDPIIRKGTDAVVTLEFSLRPNFAELCLRRGDTESSLLSIETPLRSVDAPARLKLGKVSSGKDADGSMDISNIGVHYPKRPVIYVDSDMTKHPALVDESARMSLQKATKAARPGTVIDLADGTHRGKLEFWTSGTKEEPIVLKAKNKGSASILGSFPATALQFKPVPNKDLIVADVPEEIPGFPLSGVHTEVVWLCEVDSVGVCQRNFHLARSPNYFVKETPTEAYKFLQYWYTMDGGSRAPPDGCDQRLDHDDQCGEGTHHLFHITDVGFYNDSIMGGHEVPAPGIQPLITLKQQPDLTGGRVSVSDGETGFYLKEFPIKAHDKKLGRITIDDKEGFDVTGQGSGSAGFRPFAKYMVSNKLALLDQPDEYFFDSTSRKLYLHKDTEIVAIEILGNFPEADGRDKMLEITGISNMKFINVGFSLFATSFISDQGQEDDEGAANIELDSCSFSSGGVAISIRRVLNPGKVNTQDWKVTNCEFSYLYDSAVSVQPFYQPGRKGRDEKSGETSVHRLYFADNFFHDLSYRISEPISVLFVYATNITFIRNIIKRTGSEGLRVEAGDMSNPIKFVAASNAPFAADSLVAWNLIDRNCEIKADCGALLTSGKRPFNVFTFQNMVTNTFGFTGPTSQLGETAGGGISLVMNHGYGGVFFRNIVFNTMVKGIHQTSNFNVAEGKMIVANNHIIRSRQCIRLVQASMTMDIDSYYVKNNIIADCQLAAFVVSPRGGKPPKRDRYDVDHNLYFNYTQTDRDGFLQVRFKPDIAYADLATVKALPKNNWASGWEANGFDNEDTKLIMKKYNDEGFHHFNSVNDREIKEFKISWFDTDVPDSSALEPEIIRLLKVFDICLPVKDSSKLPVGAISSGPNCYKNIGVSSDPRNAPIGTPVKTSGGKGKLPRKDEIPSPENKRTGDDTGDPTATVKPSDGKTGRGNKKGDKSNKNDNNDGGESSSSKGLVSSVHVIGFIPCCLLILIN